jgi:RIO-like serine/threonine protein kinase
MQQRVALKTDLFGSVYKDAHKASGVFQVCRDTTTARWWAKPLARLLAAREAKALAMAAGIGNIPELMEWRDGRLTRTWLSGQPMQVARPKDPAYFRDALRLLRKLHRRGIAHNDLAKEPNWLVMDGGGAGILDFQLARSDPHRGRLFRLQAREDLRHLLKHKRYYCADRLTESQRALLANPSAPARFWRYMVKPVYMWITRRVLGWQDREGAGDRQFTGAARSKDD